MPRIDRRIVLSNGPPWGFRLNMDNNGLLIVSKIRKHSPADVGKLHYGDQIISLNGINAHGLTHSQAVKIMDTTIGTFDIAISRFETTSTKILMFDRVDKQILNDVRAEVDIDLKKKWDVEMDTEDYFATEIEHPRVIIKRNPPPPVQVSTQNERVIKKISYQEVKQQNDIKPHNIPVNKLIHEYTEQNQENIFKPSKKHFADSSFFNDPQNLYPTVEERIEMARKVATSLTSPENDCSRGSKLFNERKRIAEKHTLKELDQNFTDISNQVLKSDSFNFDLNNWPVLDNSNERNRSPSPIYRLGYSSGPPPPPKSAPPPPPPNVTKTLPEYLERVKKFPTTNHDNVSPKVCYDIASALHSSNCRGAQLFAHKKSRAHKWVKESPDVIDNKDEAVMASNIGPSHNSTPITPKFHKPTVTNTFEHVTENNKGNEIQIDIMTTSATSYSKSIEESAPRKFSFDNDSKSPSEMEPARKWKPVKFSVPPSAAQSS